MRTAQSVYPPAKTDLRTRPIRAGVRLSCLLACTLGCAQAAPIRPPHGATIALAPERSQEPTELGHLRTASRSAPHDATRAADYAMALIQAFRSTQDTRYLRQAEAAVEAIDRKAEDLPARFYLARATVAQRTHRFEEALEDLDRALARDPRNRQALLTRTTVLRLLGHLDEAARSIMALYQNANSLVACTAAADLASIRGETQAAWHLLAERVLPASRQAPANVRLWIESTAAEVAWRARRLDDAEAHYKTALEVVPNDPYSLIGYADLLLVQGRTAEVIALAPRLPSNQDFRLRLLLARIAQGDSPAETARLRAKMEAQFQIDRSYRRGRHYRTEARYALEVEKNPSRAFALAKKNWSEQKEPADAHLLLQASRAAGASEFATSFQATLDEMGFAAPDYLSH